MKRILAIALGSVIFMGCYVVFVLGHVEVATSGKIAWRLPFVLIAVCDAAILMRRRRATGGKPLEYVGDAIAAVVIAVLSPLFVYYILMIAGSIVQSIKPR